MPAIKYDYTNYNQYRKSRKGVAENARSYQSSSKATQKVSSRKRVNADIDIPIIVKKKVNVPKPTEMKLNKPKVNKKVKAKTEGLKRRILLGVIIVFGLFMICIRYTQINEKFNLVNSLKEELALIEDSNSDLKKELVNKTDLNLGYIKKYAECQLGMQKPTESQIVRIAYKKQDKISTPVVIEEEKEEGVFGKLFNYFKNIID